MRLVDSATMREIDRRAQHEYGVPELVLMESAGLLAWLELKAQLSGDPALCIVAGRGNNGGDALVMARYALIGGHRVSVVLAVGPDELGEQAGLHAGIVRSLGATVLTWGEQEDACRSAIGTAGVIVDGLAGTGIRGALRAPLDTICACINAAGGTVVAVDAPSGLGDEWQPGLPVVRADCTLTMGLPKNCLYDPQGRQYCGRIRTIRLSFPPALTDDPSIPGTLLEPSDLDGILQPLDPTAYKHRRGVVAVFAGAMGTTGAAVLAATAAAHCRAGLVTIYTDPDIYPVVAAGVISVMVRLLDPAEPDRIPAIAAGADAVVVGPGWGVSQQRGAQLRSILAGLPRGVIDADGLNVFAGLGDRPPLSDSWVLTPHPGELARLLGCEPAAVSAGFFSAVRRLARETGAVVVGKSATTIVAHPQGRYAVVDGMNPAMGTGGSGDVLAGSIAGLLAGGLDGYTAASAAALANQHAGRVLRERDGLFLAEDLPSQIGRIVDVHGKLRG